MRRLLQSKYVRIIATVIIIGATFGVFGWYLSTHPEVIKTLFHLSPWIIVLLSIAYIFTIVANALILHFSLSYVKRSTPLSDNILLTIYSSIVNFFGPLQSGPGFRAVYLKKKYGIEFRRFIGATFIFYVFFAVINVVLVGIGAYIAFPSVQLPILSFFILGCIVFLPIFYWFKMTKLGKNLFSNINLQDRHFWLIGFGALLLITATAFAYGVELQNVSAHVNIWNVIVYTAAANLALFVSLTPGAIGFREAFLVFSQHLHGFSTDAIAAASVIDRAFYVLFLLVLFLLLLVFKLQNKVRFTAMTAKNE